jgi:hypothetical protein
MQADAPLRNNAEVFCRFTRKPIALTSKGVCRLPDCRVVTEALTSQASGDTRRIPMDFGNYVTRSALKQQLATSVHHFQSEQTPPANGGVLL